MSAALWPRLEPADMQTVQPPMCRSLGIIRRSVGIFVDKFLDHFACLCGPRRKDSHVGVADGSLQLAGRSDLWNRRCQPPDRSVVEGTYGLGWVKGRCAGHPAYSDPVLGGAVILQGQDHEIAHSDGMVEAPNLIAGALAQRLLETRVYAVYGLPVSLSIAIQREIRRLTLVPTDSHHTVVQVVRHPFPLAASAHNPSPEL